MKNLYKLNIAYRGIAVFAGMLIPVLLVLSIPLLFKTEWLLKEDKPPIILEMMALQTPQQKSTKVAEKVQPKPTPVKKPKPVKPSTVKKASPPKPVKKKIPKKTMIAKATLEIKEIPQPKAMLQENVSEKIQEKAPKEIQKKIIAKQQTEAALPIPVPVFKLTQGPQFLHKEALIYPEAMRSSGQTGIVKVAVLIGKEGKVYRVTVLNSAGKAFDEAAKEALMASTFLPAKVENKKVATELRMPIIFRLL